MMRSKDVGTSCGSTLLPLISRLLTTTTVRPCRFVVKKAGPAKFLSPSTLRSRTATPECVSPMASWFSASRMQRGSTSPRIGGSERRSLRLSTSISACTRRSSRLPSQRRDGQEKPRPTGRALIHDSIQVRECDQAGHTSGPLSLLSRRPA
jgi:hypothetical protein